MQTFVLYKEIDMKPTSPGFYPSSLYSYPLEDAVFMAPSLHPGGRAGQRARLVRIHLSVPEDVDVVRTGNWILINENCNQATIQQHST